MKKHCASDSDETSCLNAGFAKRILSKTSLKSSPSSSKSAEATRAQEVSRLLSEIDELKQNIEHLNNVIDSKDSAIGNLAREKESIHTELRKTQRVNRNIHQQLEDERDFYQKEKEHYCQEISSIRRSLSQDEQAVSEIQKNAQLQRDIEILRENLQEKDEIIYNLCVKYLKIRNNKNALRSKMARMNSQHHKAYDYIVSLLESSQSEIDKLISEKMQTNSITKKQYLNLVKRNARLHYENTQLKIRLASSSDATEEVVQLKVSCDTPVSKSDGKVPELRQTNAFIVKKSIYTHSHDLTNVPSHRNPRILNKKKYRSKPVEIDYNEKIKKRCSSDPG